MKKKIKVILLEDIPQVGRKYEVYEVALGYFRNYLLPKDLAAIATDEILNELKEEREKAKKAKEKRISANKDKAKEIEGNTYTFIVKAGAKGQVYGSVTAEDIIEKVSKDGYEDINVNLTHPLRNLGEEQVWIDFGDNVRAPINVILQKEESTKEKPKKETEEEKKEETENNESNKEKEEDEESKPEEEK